MFEVREVKNKEEFHPLLISKGAPLTQAWLFGEWQEAIDRKVRRFEIRDDSKILGFFQVIKYPMPFGQSFLYIPHALVLINSAEFLQEFYKTLFEIGKEENTAFVRFDSFPKTEENLEKHLKKVPAHAYHSSYFQPKFEWIIDLQKPEEEILSEMHPKTRYNIGLAKRRGVKVEVVNNNFSKNFNDFYKFLKETSERDNFNLHPKIYYENIFGTLNSNNAFLAVARHDGKVLAINLILLFGETAYYVFGGSSGEHKNLMAPHLTHWRGLIEAKNRGYKFYNFGAISGGDGYKELKGISIFKKRFSGQLLEYSDSYDLILKPFWYFLYNCYKKIR